MIQARINLLVLLGALASLWSAAAFGSGDVGLYGWYYRHSDESSSTDTTMSKWNLVIEPKYAVSGNVTIGLKGLYDRQTDSSRGGVFTTLFTAIGPAIGLTQTGAGPSASVAYLMYPQKTTTGVIEASRYGGDGYALEFAYRMAAGSLTVGPVVTYNSVTYTTEKTDNQTRSLPSGTAQSWIQGYLGLWLKL